MDTLARQMLAIICLLLRAGLQPTLDPGLGPLCRSSAPARGEEGNW